MKPLDTPRPPYRWLRLPITPTHFTWDCLLSVLPTSAVEAAHARLRFSLRAHDLCHAWWDVTRTPQAAAILRPAYAIQVILSRRSGLSSEAWTARSGALRAERRHEVFREKAAGKATKGRPQPEKAIVALGTGDVLVVAKWDRATLDR